eukprot:462017_1
MGIHFLLSTLLIIHITASQQCAGIYDGDNNPLDPLGVCLRSSESGGSGKYNCDDDGKAVLEVYSTTDCSVVSTNQDIPVNYETVICDGPRCPYAKIRTFTTGNCVDTSEYVDYTQIVDICLTYDIYSEVWRCSNNNVTREVYQGANCKGTLDSITTEYITGLCKEGTTRYEVMECNTDTATTLQMTVAVMVASFFAML